MEHQDLHPILCTKCENIITANNRYCSICGTAQNQELLYIHSKKWPNLKEIGLFFTIELLGCVSVLLVNPTIGLSIFFDVIMAITAMYFFGSDWKNNKFLLKWPDFSFIKLITYVCLTILASVIIDLLVSHLNYSLFEQTQSYYTLYEPHKYGKYLLVFSVAIFPALFEELTYRGYLMQKLVSIFDTKETVYISSILFFLIHFSMMSIFWLLPFAIILAYIRIREKTIWYGVAIHFTFNFTVCIMEILNSNGFK